MAQKLSNCVYVSINPYVFCFVGLLREGDPCDGVQSWNHRWDLFWDCILPGTSHFVLLITLSQKNWLNEAVK